MIAECCPEVTEQLPLNKIAATIVVSSTSEGDLVKNVKYCA